MANICNLTSVEKTLHSLAIFLIEAFRQLTSEELALMAFHRTALTCCTLLILDSFFR